MSKYIKSGIIGVISCLTVLILGYWTVAASAATKDKKVVPSATSVPVKVTKVSKKDMPQTIQSLGSLQAEQRVVISAEDNGRITAINFKDGQQVVKGMPIAQMDNDKAKADYQSAVTTLKVAQQKYRRSKLLLNEAVSQQELAQLDSDVQSGKAAVQKAQSVLNNKEVKAPFNGVLGSFKVQVGDYVSTGDPIVTIVNTKKLRVDFSVSESYLPKLKTDQLVKVTVAAYPKQTFYGTVSYISPTVDPATRTVAIQAVINNDKNLLKPGMFVHVNEQLTVDKNALILPQEAVMADIKGYYVFRVESGRAVQTYVKIGPRKKDDVQILSGVKLGEEVVSAGQQKLSDGSLVQVLKDDA